MKRKNAVNRIGNVPSYTLSDKMISLVAEITEIATHLEMREMRGATPRISQ